MGRFTDLFQEKQPVEEVFAPTPVVESAEVSAPEPVVETVEVSSPESVVEETELFDSSEESSLEKSLARKTRKRSV